MTDQDKEQSGALQAAASKRVELKQALSQVEVAAASPSAEAGWRTKLGQQLEGLQTALLEHIEEVEAEDGLLAEMAAEAPRLSDQIASVQGEHPGLCTQMAQTIVTTSTSDSVDDIRAEVLDMLIAIARHRQRGSDLVYEGYNVDIGGG